MGSSSSPESSPAIALPNRDQVESVWSSFITPSMALNVSTRPFRSRRNVVLEHAEATAWMKWLPNVKDVEPLGRFARRPT